MRRDGRMGGSAIRCPGFAGIIRPVFGLLEQHLMIFPHRVLVATLLLGILSAPRVWGQPATAPAGGLPLTLKSAAVIGPAETAQIKAFITGEAGKLCAVNNSGLSAAREALINEAKGGSVPFLVKNAEILNAEAQPIIA